jgi:ribosomal protein S18 acetylase RimI-like enzyme
LIKKLILRPATPEDKPLLDALFIEGRAEQLHGLGLNESQKWSLVEMQARGRRITYAAQYPTAIDLILLDEKGVAVGRLLVDRQTACWRIVDIAVRAAHRGRGLGTLALRESQRQAAAAGATLALQVMRFNPAFRLYERLGFHTVMENEVMVEMVWNAAKEKSA